MKTAAHAHPQRAAGAAQLTPLGIAQSRAAGPREEGAGRAARVPSPPTRCVYGRRCRCTGPVDLEIRPGAWAHLDCFIAADIEDEAAMFAANAIPLPDPDVEYLRTARRLPPRRAPRHESTTRRTA